MANYEQNVKNGKLSNLAGIGLIVGLLVFLYCLVTILNAMQHRFGLSYDAAVITMWVVGGGIALAMMYDRVLFYRYTLSGSTLKLDRFYGRYMRHARDIMFRKIVDMGEPEAMKAKYPGSRIEKYVRRQCEIPQVALVHVYDGKRYIALIQPDETIRTAIENRPDAKKK